MTKYLVLLGFTIVTAAAQRPSYAGSGPVGIPKVAARFQNTAANSATGTDLSNRLGSDNASSTIIIPTDARGDEDLVERLETWPRENQPFWLINAEHIEKQKHPNGMTNSGGQGSSQASLNNRNNFAQNRFTSDSVEPVADGNQSSQNRGSTSSQQLGNDTENSFTVFRNNQLKTYVYDPVSDSWILRRS
ncbi:hypothetical protein JTB14_019661 [Gonioctena quinquepunctata]|nr:hypothetical protein JTB14_019661 [Gonioctena quinquepunctata]